MEKKELKIELTPEVASGHYANFAVVAHGPGEFYLDFIAVAPNVPQAKVQTRVIMTPENVKNLLHALADNVGRYEKIFGEITHITPKNNNEDDAPNPFFGSGKLN